MPLTIATWNINSVRLRAVLVSRFLETEAPDVLCLQETKVKDEKFPREPFEALGYRHMNYRGEPSYNGVAILSKVPLEPVAHRDFCGRGDARHVAARLPGGAVLHCLYVPAGGDVPDPKANPKFQHKLDFVAEIGAWGQGLAGAHIAVGDLNIAPLEADVWSHKQLLKVVSHTPIEVEAFEAARQAGGWKDVTRADIDPAERLYSWWSYRNPNWETNDKGRRLDHIWAREVVHVPGSSRVLKAWRAEEKPSDHVPVLATFEVG